MTQRVDASPAVVAVTPSDTTFYNPPLLGIRVGTTPGAVKIQSAGEDVTIDNVGIGEKIPGNITMVYLTGTVAEGITGWQRKA